MLSSMTHNLLLCGEHSCDKAVCSIRNHLVQQFLYLVAFATDIEH